jgi:hypothetical protein
VLGRLLDVEILVLARPALRGEHRTAVHFLEVAVRELVVCLGVGGFVGVDPQVPLSVLVDSVPVNEFVLVVGGWLMLAPVVSLVSYNLPVLDSSIRDALLHVNLSDVECKQLQDYASKMHTAGQYRFYDDTGSGVWAKSLLHRTGAGPDWNALIRLASEFHIS